MSHVGDPQVRTVEEIRHGSGKVPQRLLLHHLTASAQPLVLGPGCGELTALVRVAGRFATAWTPP